MRCNAYLRQMEDIFEDLTVIELSSVLAGPYAGMLFSELGAKVIKIENARTNGDVTRNWKSKNENPETPISAYYASVNFKKEVVMMDFSKMNDINKTYELIKSADVVITNFKKGDDYKFALDYGRVKVINPKIVYAKLSGFESYPERVAYDVVVQAECGFMAMNGQASSPPTKMPVALMDVLAGHQLRSGILAALLRKEKTKKGALVEVSLEKSAIAALVNQGTNFLMNGSIPKRIGSRHPNIALYGEVFACKDEVEIVLAVGTQKQFLSLCDILNLPQLKTDKSYLTNSDRLKNLDQLTAELGQKIQSLNSSMFCDALDSHYIPYGMVKNMEAVAKSPLGKNSILYEKIEGVSSQRFSTVGFSIL